ncbi:hypothetical protein MZO42_04775 [Sphingomonas psychrotolerans]|uniref:DUF4398 domain-containing protein n=1 Tax=Sphingomonas psychrotolerans TaxID=1327635 RepID=A0ABU3N0U8_9SPHN|nr:hypothetical protein [Sphingomonas psychrotolerans]MDT8758003.1 hypothetical protein [Sphingomonas psychrotolerans]
MRSRLFAALPALAFALAGCTTDTGTYPSLLPRPIEKQSLAEPERPVPVATPDPVLDKRIAEVTASLRSGNQRFTAAAQETEAKVAVARGLPEGSSAWLDAQTALSTLESMRQPTLATLTELETMASERGQAGTPAYPPLDAAVAAADAMATAQGDRIAALEAALSGG